jgi:hypothetical protein
VTQSALVNSGGLSAVGRMRTPRWQSRLHPNGPITLFEMHHNAEKIICQNELVSIGAQENLPYFYFRSVIALCSFGHFFYQLWHIFETKTVQFYIGAVAPVNRFLKQPSAIGLSAV